MRFAPDPRFTFDTFVVGPGSRMAAAAARRAAESPGTSYNPLFVYGASGTGKTHLLHAVANLAMTVRPDLGVVCRTAEEVVDSLSAAVAAGTLEQWRDDFLDAGLLLFDDVQFLAGKARTQEELLRLWDAIDRGGAQIILAGDRPPVEIADLDEGLRARLNGGLTVDITPPDAESRAAVVREIAVRERIALAPGAAEAVAVAVAPDGKVMEGALRRVADAQTEQVRVLTAPEVSAVLDPAGDGPSGGDEFSAFLFDIATTVEQLVEAAPWRKTLAEAILRWEGEGVRTRRLEEALETDSAPDVGALVEQFAADVGRLRAIEGELRALGDERAAASPLLRDPDRVHEAEALLVQVKAPRATPAVAAPAAAPPAGPKVDRWFFNREKVAWSWIALDERIIEEIG
jgi:hypothetical protein